MDKSLTKRDAGRSFMGNICKKIFRNVHDLIDPKAEILRIKFWKKNIHKDFYHIVAEYDLEDFSITAAAHSRDSREGAFKTLKYLWSRDFRSGNLLVPEPVYYAKKVNALFYKTAEGKNLLDLLKECREGSSCPSAAVDPRGPTPQSLILLAASWLEKLHSLKTPLSSPNRNQSKIETALPRGKNFLKYIESKVTHSAILNEVKDIFKELTAREKNNFKHIKKTLVHGDYHLENLIIQDNILTVVDFTDTHIGDPARDIGTFFEQLSYMRGERDEELEKIFWDAYGSRIDGKRINLYKAWSTFRAAVVFLTQLYQNESAAQDLLNSAKNYLKN